MRIVTPLVLVASLVANAAWAADVDRRLEACEAADMARLLGAPGKGEWQGERHILGPWSFASRVSVSCADAICDIGSGLDARHETEGVVEPQDATAAHYRTDPHGHVTLYGWETVLAPAPNTGQSLRRVQGAAARDLIEAMAPYAYEGPHGRQHLVWMDYGDIGGIRVRARTALACAVQDDTCDILSSILVYAPDSGHNEAQQC